MSSNINYSIVSNDTGATVVRSTVKSFNLDHVTDKDIVSFYRNFSSFAMFDTGLMPLSGTGVLAIRSAGNHTQITFQHQPQINHINWGATEGDRDARTYTVAQPYRIWIGDLIDGNLYGARMFYSPYPITSPDQPLYHLNLPNTNCKGYRGNGVGWQCLYHKDTWDELPFNEKIVRFAERCSGVETYNDANMSETDGPRFYQENDMPKYTWDPMVWQDKTSQEGIDWVYNPENWIPILVQDQDHQDKHYQDGVPLTIQMAMLGDYQAYYTDNYRPKPINILSRSDLSLDNKKITNWISIIHNSSSSSDSSYNPLEASVKAREVSHITIATNAGFSDDDEEDEDNYIICPISGEACQTDDPNCDSLGNSYCEPCFSESVAYCENTDTYLPHDHPNVKWIEHEGIYINDEDAIVRSCSNCGEDHWCNKEFGDVIKTIYTSTEDEELCSVCITSYITQHFDQSNDTFSIGNNNYKASNCSGCAKPLILGDAWSHIFPSVKVVALKYNEDNTDHIPYIDYNHFCPQCSGKYMFCPTGHYVTQWNNPLRELPKEWNITVYNNENNSSINTTLTHLCEMCTRPEINQDNDMYITPFSPENHAFERYQFSVINNLAFGTFCCINNSDPTAPF
jgi:hypothetical protein